MSATADQLAGTSPATPPFDIMRAAFVELQVTDLAASEHFYAELLGMIVSARSDDAVFLRGWEERQHHSLILRQAPLATASRLGFRVRTENDLDLLSKHFASELRQTRWIEAGSDPGMGRSLRVWDPFGYPLEFFHTIEQFETQHQRFDLHRGAPLLRFDHLNLHTPRVEDTLRFWLSLGFRCSEYISTDDPADERITGAWMLRKPTVHDVALTAGTGPRLHHFAYWIAEPAGVLRACDQLAGGTAPRSSSGDPDATGCPTRSSCTSATPTGTASSCTRVTTTPATRTTSRCAGRSTIRAADRSGELARPTAGMTNQACSLVPTARRRRSRPPTSTSALSTARCWRDPADGRLVAAPEWAAATKVIAVHLNYHSRAAQRGRVPTEPSYFLKPTSSLSAGGELVRPRGTELLAFEGEIAVIIGTPARDVTPEQAADHIACYAPANDFGVHDFRWADRGSNVLAKGQDGFTPIGPALRAEGVDPVALRLITRINGEVRQDATGADLIFTFAQLIADLSRFMTLEPGDVILTGTPAGANVVVPGDVVEVSLEGAGSVTSTIVEAAAELRPYGAMPKVTAEARAFATGVDAPRPATLSDDGRALLHQVSTATLTVQLDRRGIRSTFLTGLRPTRPDLRMVGYAHTLRYVAIRADVREAMKGSEDAQKRAIESVSPGDVLIMEARNETSAGTIGDILAARVLARGGTGIVTDGGVRDTPGVSELAIPTYYRVANGASLWNAHIPLDVGVPITCAGVLVMPGDVIVGDGEGVVILPAALAEEIAHDAYEVEQRESFALERVRAGESFRGLFPLSEQRRPDYERWLSQRDQEQI